MTAARSLRARLLAAVIAASAVVLLASGVALYLSVRASLLNELDSALVQQAQVMTSVFEWNHGRVDLELGRLAEPDKAAPSSRRYFEVWQQGVGLLARSPDLRGLHLPRPQGVFRSPHLVFAELPNGRRVRLLAVTVRPMPEGADDGSVQKASAAIPRVTLLLASELDNVRIYLMRLAYLLAAVGLAAILASAGGAWWAVGFGLRPMRALARRIEGLGEDDLGQRVDLPSAPSELLSVVERLNQLLDRLEAAFGREKALLANLAHELRTPLAGLSFTLEVCLSRPRTPLEYEEDMRQCLIISRQMQGMVDNLLTLARLDAGQGQPEKVGPVDLEGALRQAWSPLAEQARAKDLSVQWRLSPGLAALAPPYGLAIILRNLLTNAVDYAEAGGRVWLDTRREGDGAEIEVANTGCGLAPRDADKVFERFWRGDSARSGDQAHAGLGLALSRQMADAMGGDLKAGCDEQGRFCITLRLPGAGAGPA